MYSSSTGSQPITVNLQRLGDKRPIIRTAPLTLVARMSDREHSRQSLYRGNA